MKKVRTVTKEIEVNTHRLNWQMIIVMILLLSISLKLSDIYESLELSRCKVVKVNNETFSVPYKCKLPEGFKPEDITEWKKQ